MIAVNLILFVFCNFVYASLDCTSNEKPYVNGLLVPLDIDLQFYIQPTTFDALRDVYFILYTRKNPSIGENITSDGNSIKTSSFNRLKPTRVLIHGWKDDHTSAVNTQITAGYLKNGDFNVVRFFHFSTTYKLKRFI